MSSNGNLRALIAAVLVAAAFPSLSAGAQDFNSADWDNTAYDLSLALTEVNGVAAPRIHQNHIIFTADSTPRFVGIVFDFEGYRTVHPMERMDFSDMDDEVTGSLNFYVLSVPADLDRIAYKLVMDGLWVTDSANPDRIYDRNVGFVSRVEIPRSADARTGVVNLASSERVNSFGQGTVKTRLVRFVFPYAEGQHVTLTGDFTSWDPFLYDMNETTPGTYELTLPLAPGTYKYQFVRGFTEYTDPGNPARAYSIDGRDASVITVK